VERGDAIIVFFRSHSSLSLLLIFTQLKFLYLFPFLLQFSFFVDARLANATPLLKELAKLISLRGPISVAEYMRQALTHPQYGYYTGASQPSEIFGEKGDFTTSPEISQVFGELLCIWVVKLWKDMGEPEKVTLIELGPGKGTLAADFLRAARSSFPAFTEALKRGSGVHFIEKSPHLRHAQCLAMSVKGMETHKYDDNFITNGIIPDDSNSSSSSNSSSGVDKSSNRWSSEAEATAAADKGVDNNDDNDNDKESIDGIPARWHDHLEGVSMDVNKTGAQFIIAQELLDALPLHVFEKTNKGWRERLVSLTSVDEEVEKTNGDSMLKFVVSKDTTAACRTLLNVDSYGHAKESAADDSRVGDILEVCPDALSLTQDIAARIAVCGGGALIVDYGSMRGTGDSLRAYKSHEQVHPLTTPGEVDVTFDVDFLAVKSAAESFKMSATNAAAVAYATVNADGGGSSHSITSEALEAKEANPAPRTVAKLKVHGPTTQGEFLCSMGIIERVSALMESPGISEKQGNDLYSALEMLVTEEAMGEKFKVLAITRDGQDVVGFVPLPEDFLD
jgi:NADH dehydrogenase [ubiquinone] 1 alpha subcomplex assembly factor 7